MRASDGAYPPLARVFAKKCRKFVISIEIDAKMLYNIRWKKMPMQYAAVTLYQTTPEGWNHQEDLK